MKVGVVPAVELGFFASPQPCHDHHFAGRPSWHSHQHIREQDDQVNPRGFTAVESYLQISAAAWCWRLWAWLAGVAAENDRLAEWRQKSRTVACGVVDEACCINHINTTPRKNFFLLLFSASCFCCLLKAAVTNIHQRMGGSSKYHQQIR